MTRISLVGVALAITGCASSDVPGINFPRYEPRPAVPAALNEGTLVEREGCLVLEGPTTSVLLWPRTYGVVRDGEQLVVVDGTRAVAAVGSPVVVAGGELTETADARSIVDTLPTACHDSPYWQVTRIEEGSINLHN